MINKSSLNSKKEDITNIYKQLREKGKISRLRVLDLIRKNQPLSVYGLAKIMETSYATAHQIVKEFEFADLIQTRVEINKNNRAVRIIFISEKKSREGKNDNKEC